MWTKRLTRHLMHFFNICCLLSFNGCDKNEHIDSARAYVKAAALEIISSLEFHGINEMPKRDEKGILIIDSLVSDNRDLPQGVKFKSDTFGKTNESRPKFQFPSTFVSSPYFVKSGLITNDSRKHAFEFVVLWKSNKRDFLRKTSIVITLDREILCEKDEYVDNNWAASKIIEFPDRESKTYLKIAQFNRDLTAQ